MEKAFSFQKPLDNSCSGTLRSPEARAETSSFRPEAPRDYRRGVHCDILFGLDAGTIASAQLWALGFFLTLFKIPHAVKKKFHLASARSKLGPLRPQESIVSKTISKSAESGTKLVHNTSGK